MVCSACGDACYSYEVDHLGVKAMQKVHKKHEKAAMFAMAVKC